MISIILVSMIRTMVILYIVFTVLSTIISLLSYIAVKDKANKRVWLNRALNNWRYPFITLTEIFKRR